MNLSHGQCDAHNMYNGVVGETSELMQKRGEQMSQEYLFIAKMILGLSTTISRLLPPCCGVVKINC
jgi:hypothetical protein